MVNVVDLQRRTMRYEFADGIREFQLAFWLVVVGVYSWVVWDKLPEWGSMVETVRAMGSGVAVIVFLVLPIAIPVLASHYGLMWINERVRRRWLWRWRGAAAQAPPRRSGCRRRSTPGWPSGPRPRA